MPGGAFICAFLEVAVISHISPAAVVVSSVVWIIEIVANSAPLFHDELFQDRFNHTFCFEKYPMQDWVAGMNLYRTFLGFLAPWTAMLVAYRGILVAVRCNVSTERQEKAKIQRLALSLILIVLLCFGPYHILLLVRSVMFLNKPCDCGSEENLFAAYHVSLALTSLNCVADPILYCFVNEGARNDVSRALSALISLFCKRGSSSSPSHGDMLNTGSVTVETPLSTKKQPCVYADGGKTNSYKTELVALKEECLQMTILTVRKWLWPGAHSNTSKLFSSVEEGSGFHLAWEAEIRCSRVALDARCTSFLSVAHYQARTASSSRCKVKMTTHLLGDRKMEKLLLGLTTFRSAFISSQLYCMLMLAR